MSGAQPVGLSSRLPSKVALRTPNNSILRIPSNLKLLTSEKSATGKNAVWGQKPRLKGDNWEKLTGYSPRVWRPNEFDCFEKNGMALLEILPPRESMHIDIEEEGGITQHKRNTVFVKSVGGDYAILKSGFVHACAMVVGHRKHKKYYPVLVESFHATETGQLSGEMTIANEWGNFEDILDLDKMSGGDFTVRVIPLGIVKKIIAGPWGEKRRKRNGDSLARRLPREQMLEMDRKTLMKHFQKFKSKPRKLVRGPMKFQFRVEAPRREPKKIPGFAEGAGGDEIVRSVSFLLPKE